MIYVVRHGETDWNKIGKYAGRKDTPLNDTGINQANKIKEKLKDIKFDVVFSSPLSRAYMTAKIICDNDILTDNRIIERSNGLLEGKLKSEIHEEIDFNNPNEERYNIENIADFRKRINSFLNEITNKYKKKDILIVTHAGVSIYIRCYFEGEPSNGNYRKYKLDNCEILMYNN